MQHAIVHEVGWRQLRPVQEQATAAILDGANAVVLAPTAGGKTEASIVPVLSLILDEQPPPVAALYVCPIRALLNNQESRIQGYARMVGLDAFKWHGDVAPTSRARFLRHPAHVLMTTPESIEVMMVSQKTDARRLFAGLRVVIVDEVHAFADDDRGAHLASLLERLVHFCGHDLQRIGLSATVGNPDEIGAWLQGSSQRPYRRVDPGRAVSQRDLRVDLFEDIESVAREAARLGQGKKSLVFAESRSAAEKVASQMAGRGVEVFVHHSAVSRSDRELAESRFQSGQNSAIVCTSTLELGIDVGDLDLVLQVDAPSSVASFLQRMGRTGRRAGTWSNTTFLCQTPESMLQALALVNLAQAGWVEPVKPSREAAHVLAHQILALTLQEGGLSRHRLMAWLGRATCFRGLSSDDVNSLLATMLREQILHEADGLFSLGSRGEKLYGAKNFLELYSVFSTPAVFRVRHGTSSVGTVHGSFLRLISGGEGRPCFRLAGRAWQVVQNDWNTGVCQVEPATAGRVPNWMGSPEGLSFELCQQVKSVLASEEAYPWLSATAVSRLGSVRASYEGLVDPDQAPVEVSGSEVRWHTFAGGTINRLLASALEGLGGGHWTYGNLSLKSRDASSFLVGDLVAALRQTNWHEEAIKAAHEMPAGALAKFEPCLPPELQERLRLERYLDEAGTAAFVGSHRVT